MNFYLALLVLTSLLTSSEGFDYCSVSPRHTLCRFSTCRYGPNCFYGTTPIPYSMTPADKDFILKNHNDFRRDVALGYVTNFERLPPASNMRQLTWDDELAEMAQAWANQCMYGEDENRTVPRFAVWQNTYEGSSCNLDYFEPFMDPSGGWIIEPHFLNETNVQDFSTITDEFGRPAMTQLMWADTYKLGCGLARTTSYMGITFCRTVFVCNYGPAGNQPNQPVYKIGPAASDCPPSTTAKDYLCV